MKTVRMTMAQALVRFLDNQFVMYDGKKSKFVHGVFSIFGHGNVVGLGEALVEMDHSLIVYQGHNEQGMTHAATAFAKQRNRRQICAVTSSIGPGALNMVTAAATATVNRIPVLLLPGDSFACRQPDPVLQQVEHSYDPGITANDAFKSASVFWDRISRPDQLMTACLQAMRYLTDPAETGAVTLCLPQDVQAEAYDYPTVFFEERIWEILRTPPAQELAERIAGTILKAEKPLVICGGGVRYSDAGAALDEFCTQNSIPFSETQAGRGVLPWDHPLNLGGIGVTGGAAANHIAAQADLVIAVGTRLGDFTTASKSAFANPDLGIVAVNIGSFDANKMAAAPMVCDAREGLIALTSALASALASALKGKDSDNGYGEQIENERKEWTDEVDRLYRARELDGMLTQTGVMGMLNEELLPTSAVVVGSSGSLPGDMQRLWRVRESDTYHMEYGFSCMGYEISGAVGAKIAEPDREVVSMVGDGSYIMLHSELVTAVREGIKIIVVVFDNSGYQCIDNLQTSQGISSYATYFRTRDGKGRLDGPVKEFDFAANAAAYGVSTWTVRSETDLTKSVGEALAAEGPCLIDVKVAPKSMTDGYDSWWRVGVPEVSESEAVRGAYADHLSKVKDIRPY